VVDDLFEPPFEHGSLHQGILRCFVTRNELPALLITPLVDGHMKKKLANVQEAMYPLVASEYSASCIFYTDGSLIEGCVGFAFHQMGGGGFGH
jgi:hypothetical protein